MYKELSEIGSRPEVFSAYTAEKLWNDPLLENDLIVTEYYSDVRGKTFHPDKDEFAVIAKKRV